jgi:hypothetical protein
MIRCLAFHASSTGSNGTAYEVFLAELQDVDTCANVNNTQIIMDVYDYIELEASATALVDIDTVSALLDPLEMSAAFSGGFMLILTMSLIAFKIKIAKRVIKMA